MVEATSVVSFSLSLLVAGLNRVMAAPLSDGPVMSIQA